MLHVTLCGALAAGIANKLDLNKSLRRNVNQLCCSSAREGVPDASRVIGGETHTH